MDLTIISKEKVNIFLEDVMYLYKSSKGTELERKYKVMKLCRMTEGIVPWVVYEIFNDCVK